MLNFLNLKSFSSYLFFCSSIQPQHGVRKSSGSQHKCTTLKTEKLFNLIYCWFLYQYLAGNHTLVEHWFFGIVQIVLCDFDEGWFWWIQNLMGVLIFCNTASILQFLWSFWSVQAQPAKLHSLEYKFLDNKSIWDIQQLQDLL